MGKGSDRQSETRETESDSDRSSDQPQADGFTDDRSQATDDSIGSLGTSGRSGQVRESSIGRTSSERDSGSHGDDGRYVDYERGPDPRALSTRYGMDVRETEARTLQRLEREFGRDRVGRWADEGMPVATMGRPRDMEAFRTRQAERSDEIPTDIERRNEASRRRNAARSGTDGPAGRTSVPDAVRRVISSPGRSMDETVQREMENKMRGGFSDVRIHTGPRAAAAADSIDARAFTVGNHVAFNAGEYDPETDDGKRLLAHELTHVRQQTEGAVSLLPKADVDHPAAQETVGAGVHVQPKLKVSSPDDPAEKEAEAVAEEVLEMDDRAAATSATDANPSTSTTDAGGGTTDPDRALSEKATGTVADGERRPDANSVGRPEDATDSKNGTDGTAQSQASATDATHDESLSSANASAMESAPEVEGPGDSSNRDGTPSVGRRELRTAQAGVGTGLPEVEALYADGPLQPNLAPNSQGDSAERGAETPRSRSDSSTKPAGDHGPERHHPSMDGSGKPLPPSERSFFESRFERDFGTVRVHTGDGANRVARKLGAYAFTHGNHVGFAEGEYDPGSTAGRRLIAHELTHTIQQAGTPPAHSSSVVSGTDGAAEREAEAVADRIMNHEPPGRIRDTSSALQLQSGRGRRRQRARLRSRIFIRRLNEKLEELQVSEVNIGRLRGTYGGNRSGGESESSSGGRATGRRQQGQRRPPGERQGPGPGMPGGPGPPSDPVAATAAAWAVISQKENDPAKARLATFVEARVFLYHVAKRRSASLPTTVYTVYEMREGAPIIAVALEGSKDRAKQLVKELNGDEEIDSTFAMRESPELSKKFREFQTQVFTGPSTTE